MLKKNIFITGFMGTGKSAVACALSNQTGKKCIDMDSIIENREGKPIVDIFNEDGEIYFRKLEKEVLIEIIKKKDLIVATGGGTLLDEENCQLVRKHGIIILLWARPEVIFNRLKKENIRPLLSGENKLGKIVSLMNKRKELYSKFTRYIDTSDIPVEEVVSKVLNICQGDEHENNRYAI